jgi:hypothetical protein
MRTLLGFSIATVIAVTVWWIVPIHAKQQYGTVSIDTLSITATATNLLPEVQYDQGTVFLPSGVHYN